LTSLRESHDYSRLTSYDIRTQYLGVWRSNPQRWAGTSFNDSDTHLFFGGSLPRNVSFGNFKTWDFFNDLVVPSGKTLNAGAYSNIRFGQNNKLVLNGNLNVSGSNEEYTIAPGSGYEAKWGGIEINSGGSLDIDYDFLIEEASTGIKINTSSSGFENTAAVTKIQNCDRGIHVYNCAPWIKKVKFSNILNEAIYVESASSAPNIYYTTIDGANDGVKSISTADIYLKYSNIKNAVNDFIDLGFMCGIDSYWAQNNIVYFNSSGGHSASGYAINNNLSPGLLNLYVGSTWWGKANPTTGDIANLFAVPDDVNYLPFSSGIFNNGAPAKIAGGSQIAEYSLNEALNYELNGNWQEALLIMNDIVRSSPDLLQRRMAIKSIMRIDEQQKLGYAALRTLLTDELKSAQGWYKASLDFILCDHLAKEGKYKEAIQAFSTKADNYKGTPYEVEYLARIAVIYGELLHDKQNAKAFADKAAAINPGQAILATAYSSAGVGYNPGIHADVFEDYAQSDYWKPESQSTKIEDTVTVSPNPANPVTTITYSIKSPSNVRLTIYSITGQKVATLVDGPMSTGSHSVTFNGSKYASGVYFYRFESPGMIRSGKMLLLK
jgi:tetratricopeptide (TPR) repeat protein